jgi:hypothetical protein
MVFIIFQSSRLWFFMWIDGITFILLCEKSNEMSII